MNQALALRVLDDIMVWDEGRRLREFEWLQLIAGFKYDSYKDYLAGLRFIEALADWLQQFEKTERECAYQFVKENLVFFGPGEINHLVELVYHNHVQPELLEYVANALQMKRYLVWSNERSLRLYSTYLRQCLFFGLSDGARIDTFRRNNAHLIRNDQVLLATEISDEKWVDVLQSLRDELKDSNARFKMAYLIDDFAGTGSTLLRFRDDKWKGRLVRFWESLPEKNADYFEEDYSVHIHHFIATEMARAAIEANLFAIKEQRGKKWFPSVTFSFGTVLSNALRITPENAGAMKPLIEKYYNSSLETKSTRVGGTDDIRYGYGYCGLPLILEHNTPNNSLPLLWADTSSSNGQHEMRPLFRRRQRHSS